jgi:hypothetical protein
VGAPGPFKRTGSRGKNLIPKTYYGPAARAATLAVAGVAIIACLMALRGPMPWWDPAFRDFDHMAYLAMARDGLGAPGKASAPPFCWRILTPLLAGALPFPEPAAFYVLSFVFVAAATFLIWVLLRQEGFSPGEAMLGEIAYLSLFYAVGFNLWAYMMVDALSILVVVAGLVVLQRRTLPASRRRWILAALLLAGALNKESFLVLAAAFFVHDLRAGDGSLARRIARASLVIAPAVAAAAIVRLSITADPSQMPEFPNYSLTAVIAEMISNRLRHLGGWLAEVLIDPWGPMILSPLILAPARSARWLVERPHLAALLAMAVLQTFAGTSVARLLIVAAPVAVLFTLESLRSVPAGHAGWSGPLLALLALQFLFQYLRRTTLGLSIPPYAPSPLVNATYVVRAAALAASLLLWTGARRLRARPAR